MLNLSRSVESVSESWIIGYSFNLSMNAECISECWLSQWILNLWVNIDSVSKSSVNLCWYRCEVRWVNIDSVSKSFVNLCWHRCEVRWVNIDSVSKSSVNLCWHRCEVRWVNIDSVSKSSVNLCWHRCEVGKGDISPGRWLMAAGRDSSAGPAGQHSLPGRMTCSHHLLSHHANTFCFSSAFIIYCLIKLTPFAFFCTNYP